MKVCGLKVDSSWAGCLSDVKPGEYVEYVKAGGERKGHGYGV